MVRGEVFRLPAPTRARGREQQGARYAIVVQADDYLGLSTVLVAPTSARAETGHVSADDRCARHANPGAR